MFCSIHVTAFVRGARPTVHNRLKPEVTPTGHSPCCVQRGPFTDKTVAQMMIVDEKVAREHAV